MALLIFPPNPVDGELYPQVPTADQNQYQWEAASNTWRLLGTATGVVPGVYCAGDTLVPQLTIDVFGRVTNADCVELTGFVKTNNTFAFNDYVWPSGNGLAGQFLTDDGYGNLTWQYSAFGEIPGFGLVVTGGNILKVSIPISATPPLAGPGPDQAIPGSLYWDSTLQNLFIYYDDGVTQQWVSASSGAGPGNDFMRLNNASAYNDYIWPSDDGAPGQVLTTDGGSILSWATFTPTGAVGLGLELNGGFTKVSVPILNIPPSPGLGENGAVSGSLYWDNELSELYIYYDDGISSQWVPASPGGGGGADAGLGLIEQTNALKVAIPMVAIPPAPGTGQNEAVPGSMYWDTELSELYIYYDDGVTQQWVSASGGGGGSSYAPGLGLVEDAGALKVSIPTVTTPPAPGPGPTEAQSGSLYWDSNLSALFIYYDDGVTAQWVPASPGAVPPAAGYGLISESGAYKVAFPAASTPPTPGTGPGQVPDGSMYYDTDLGAMFYLYNDGVSTQWVEV